VNGVITIGTLATLQQPAISCTMVVVDNKDRPCNCINPNRAHTLTPPYESSSTTKETLDIHLCPPESYKCIRID